MRKLKKLLLIGGLVAIVLFVVFAILIIMVISWLWNRGSDQIQHAGEKVTSQIQVPDLTLESPLQLESYISNGQVDTAQLEESFNAVPAQLQDVWLQQFQTQLDGMREQAGVSDQTIKTLTDTYNALTQLQQ